MDGNDYDTERPDKRSGRPKGGKIDLPRPDYIKQAKEKAASYCAYQERTQQEVRDKLYALGLHQEEVEEVLTELILDNFINEERFAKSFARGKFNFNKWGRLKIRQTLKLKRLSDRCIEEGLNEIDDADYHQMIETLAEKKMTILDRSDVWATKNKTARYLIGKGFEAELVWNVVNDKLA
ncbi:MAG: regulatory protein RecX [Cyclobacteriaceae bacterium]